MNRRIARIRDVSRWSARVLEAGPHGARAGSTRILGIANSMLSRWSLEVEAEMRALEARGSTFHWSLAEENKFEQLMVILARHAKRICLEYLIQAPPGLHGRLMRHKGYRERLPYMKAF